MSRFLSVFVSAALLAAAQVSVAIEDLYEAGGSDRLRWNQVTNESTEVYKNWIEGMDFAEHHFSPAYSNDPSDFWDRVDKQAPNPIYVIHSLWNIPKHLIWDTPKSMALNLKADYYDTLKESDTGLEITQDMLTGLPNTAMLGLNGMYDSGTNFYTDLYTPVLGGVLVLWPTRLVSGLLRDPAPSVYNVVDVIPKTLWSVALPIRKLMITAGDQVQKGANFVYRSVTGPMEIPSHAERYWPMRTQASYSSRTFVPTTPQSTQQRPSRQGSSSGSLLPPPKYE